MRRRGFGGAGGALALAAVLLGAAPAASAAAPPQASALAAVPALPAVPGATSAPGTGLPPPPACATAVSLSDGAATTKALPLPAPASAVGGERLAQTGLQVDPVPGAPRPPAVRTTAWMVADLDTGAVLAACNAHVPLAPASTLKILTALALHPRFARATRYVARPEDAAIDGTKVGLSPGSTYSVDDLWHGLLLGSGNDTASALAALAGGEPKAAALMTTTARSLGAEDTAVANTSGLDAPGQVSSAYDLALFGRALLRDPALASLVRTRLYAFPSKHVRGKARATYQIANHNLLLSRYAGITGVKNGYTTAAGASLVVSARRGSHGYIVTMLRGQPDVWKLGASLLDWAFAHAGQVTPVGTLDVPPAPAAGTAAPPATGGATGGGAGGSSGGVGTTPAPVGGGRNAVAAPVRATLDSITASSRTVWLLVGLGVALAGAAVVRRVALNRASTPAARRGRPAGRARGRTGAKQPSRSARPRTPTKRPAR